MFSHIMVGTNDPEAAVRFYDAVLGCLGLRRDPEDSPDSPAGRVWYHPSRRWPQFAVRPPFDGRPASVGNGVQVSFSAPSEQAVRDCWETALKTGGSDEGGPGLRPRYNDDFFSAYCRDPDGNKLCFVHAGGLGSSKEQGGP